MGEGVGVAETEVAVVVVPSVAAATCSFVSRAAWLRFTGSHSACPHSAHTGTVPYIPHSSLFR